MTAVRTETERARVNNLVLWHTHPEWREQYVDASDVVVLVNGVRVAGPGVSRPVRGVGDSGLVDGDEGRA